MPDSVDERGKDYLVWEVVPKFLKHRNIASVAQLPCKQHFQTGQGVYNHALLWSGPCACGRVDTTSTVEPC